MPWPWNRKQQPSRRTLAFACDEILAFRAKALANVVEVPKYPTFEHCLGIGVAFVLGQVDGDEEAKEKLREHLRTEHLFVERLAHDEDITLEDVDNGWAEQHRAINLLTDQFREVGVPPEIVLQAVATLATKLARRRKLEKKLMRLQQRVDVAALKRVYDKRPRLVSLLIEALAACDADDLQEILAEEGTTRGRKARNSGVEPLGS